MDVPYRPTLDSLPTSFNQRLSLKRPLNLGTSELDMFISMEVAKRLNNENLLTEGLPQNHQQCRVWSIVLQIGLSNNRMTSFIFQTISLFHTFPGVWIWLISTGRPRDRRWDPSGWRQSLSVQHFWASDVLDSTHPMYPGSNYHVYHVYPSFLIVHN